MSSLLEIDPRLRDTATPTNAYSQRPSGASLSTPLAPDPSLSPALQHQQYPPIHDGVPHQDLSPYTPQSASNEHDHDGGGNDTQDGGPNDPKRPRACEACRGLKVRCEADANNPDGPCKRCTKARRNCVVTAPSRKRQKKTDSRVAELEKKIDALTASLKATKPDSPLPGQGSENALDNSLNTGRNNPYQQVTNGGFGPPFIARSDAARVHSNEWTRYPKAPEFDMRKSIAPPMVMAGQKRKHFDGRDSISESTGRRSVDTGAGPHQVSHGDSISSQQKSAATNEYADVVDRGLVTADMAAKLFDCYVARMAPHLPAVVFPVGTAAAEVRKNKPTLFLAILAAASGAEQPRMQKTLTKEIMSTFADRIICNGEKTLELIQALHVSTLWYWPPEHFEELKFYQLIHIAAVMAIDIGIGNKSKVSKPNAAGLWRDRPWRRTPFPAPESIEARRAWLACYFLCCNASMGLRRPNLIRWTPFMADCVAVLETSPEAAVSDKVLCQWVRSQQIAEEVGAQFSMDDPTAIVSIADSKVQYALKGFERDLEKWSIQIPLEIQSPTLKMTEHVVNLYIHEVAMHVDHNVDEFKPPFSEATLRRLGGDKPEPLTRSHIDALSTCLKSIDGIFDNFLKFDAEIIRCLPIANFVRVAYAVVVLIKMYFSAATPNSELGKVIDKDNMKVEQYLDGLVDIFRAAASEEKSRPASKFLMVLTMLKAWFHRQREDKMTTTTQPAEASTIMSVAPAASPNAPASLPDNKPRQNLQSQQPGYGPATTPLHVLSDLATGNQGGTESRTEASSAFPSTQADWNAQQYPNYDPAIMGANAAGFASVPTNMGNIDPALGMDLGYAMGDGFEQAMGMTLGAGDFGNYFSDDTFFNSILDSVGGGSGFDGF